MKHEIRTTMTVRDAIKLYPGLLDELIENMEYPTDNRIPSAAVFQLIGDGNYRTKELQLSVNGRHGHDWEC